MARFLMILFLIGTLMPIWHTVAAQSYPDDPVIVIIPPSAGGQ
jgi:tripartite-type tricarboxylate transporter receptor subunit TctC